MGKIWHRSLGVCLLIAFGFCIVAAFVIIYGEQVESIGNCHCIDAYLVYYGRNQVSSSEEKGNTGHEYLAENEMGVAFYMGCLQGGFFVNRATREAFTKI